MATFYMRETSTLPAERKVDALKATTLTQAKREASRRQCFQGTYLCVLNERGTTLAMKGLDGRWSTRHDWQVAEEEARVFEYEKRFAGSCL